MLKNFFETNALIGEKLKSNEPFSVMRIDNTAGYVLDCLDKGTLPIQSFYNQNTLVEGGIVPSTLQYAFSVVMPKTVEVMKNADILGFVDLSGEVSRNTNFLSNFPDVPMFFGDPFLVMDPGALLGYSKFGPVETPWTECLKGKRVLVVSSHASTIKEQWKKIDQIWGDKKEKIVPFELVDAISTPYHPAIDDRQYLNCDNFESLVEITKNIIDQYSYDVLLTGVTTQSPFYADHAKRSGKVGIQTGGTIQLFFGILGKRWVHGAPYSNWKNMFNEHWTYPLEIDQPQKIDKIRFLETSYAYWG